MLTLLATCYLTGQLLFSVPEGWIVTEVYSGGNAPSTGTMVLTYCPPECEEHRKRAFVKMIRYVIDGETAKMPDGCHVVLAKEKN